ncbi:MAG: leucyl/phenylalanyl-tRNA--protein transferase [Limnohabitans sp.]
MKPSPLLIQLSADDPLPSPHTAWGEHTPAPGLLAIGGGLSVPRLLQAYSQGCFPWYSAGQPVMWWCTDPRMVLNVNEFRLHRSYKKLLRRLLDTSRLQIQIDQDFLDTINRCAHLPRKGQSGTWIVEDMVQAYTRLHSEGYAHSIQAWVDGQLAGGLYCVSIGRAVFGESMFSNQTDGSKLALAALVALCRANHVPWIDCQQNTKHLASLGAKPIPRPIFLRHVDIAIKLSPLSWKFESIYWKHLGID